MGIYAGLGVSQALFNFFMGAMFALLTYYASQRLHKVIVLAADFLWCLLTTTTGSD